MNRIIAEFKYAFRTLRRRPTFTALSVLTIALVVGAGSAVFAVANATILKSLPFPQSSRLTRLFMQPPRTFTANERTPLYAFPFLRLREHPGSFEAVEGFWAADVALGGEEEPESVVGARVTPGVFALLGGTPIMGRTITAEEDRPGVRVVVLSHALWQRRYGGDDKIVGKSVLIDRQSYQVIGVMPADFEPAYIKSELWTPLGIDIARIPNPGASYMQAVARLRPGATAAQAKAELDALLKELENQKALTSTGWRSVVLEFREATFGSRGPAIRVLALAVAVLALLACANIANLTLAQAAGRRTESALRAALGASRVDLLRLSVVESLIVGIGGVTLGVPFAIGVLPLVLTLDPTVASAIGRVHVDWRVLLVGAISAQVISLVSRIIPVIRDSRGDLAIGIADGGVRAIGSRRSRRLQSALLVVQTALALVLLVSGGVLLIALQRISRMNPGYDPSGVLVMRLRLSEQAYPTIPSRAQAITSLVENIRRTPGVVDVGAGLNQFVPGFYYVSAVTIDGRPAADGQPYTTQFRRATPGYFRTLAIPLLAGRTFDEHDVTDAPPVVIVSKSFADRYWPGEDPLGRVIMRASGKLTVVGVVGDVRDYDLNVPGAPTVYVSYGQNNVTIAPVALMVKTNGDPMKFATAVRSAILAVDPQQPVDRMMALTAFLSETLGPQRFRSVLLLAFATLGLLLASVGIYGTTELAVRERIPEVGVRLALGAGPASVWGLLMTQTLTPVGIGLLIGAIGSALATWWLTKTFPGLETPPIAIALAAVALIVSAFIAAAWPARRAAAIDPVTALRAD